MKRLLFVVVYIDNGESCDGKPRVQGIYKTYDEALKNLHADMETYVESLTEGSEYEMDKDGFSVNVEDGIMSCEWAIEEIDADI